LDLYITKYEGLRRFLLIRINLNLIVTILQIYYKVTTNNWNNIILLLLIFPNLEQKDFQIRKNCQLHKYFKYTKKHQINLSYTKEGISINSHKVLFEKRIILQMQ
jgi:hypothetical protein